MSKKRLPRVIAENIDSIYEKNEVFYNIDDNASILIQGTLVFGEKSNGMNGRSTLLRMDSNSQLIVKGSFRFYYGADIKVFSGAKLILGNNSYINSDCKISVANSISIGDRCAISHDFTIIDSDFHAINGKKESIPVEIGNHVLIGTRVTVLKGCKIGDGCIIGAGSVVTKSFPPKCMIAGNPAVIIKEDVEWE